MKEMNTNSMKQEQTMANHQMKLINGKFEAEDAYDILNSLITNKIQYHNLKNLSSMVRAGHEDELSQRRLKELRIDRDYINDIIEKAKRNGTKLNVEATVVIREV